uniref:RRM domain-containing protein n=1 Tax=Steinernema glaseri TaxID=37863 RepID=A0A1I7YSF3_9BILA
MATSCKLEEEEMKKLEARMMEIEREAKEMQQLHRQVVEELGPPQQSEETQPYIPTPEEQAEIDSRSVYVGNVDYETTPTELAEHFGTVDVERITIMTNKYTGEPKGYAYMEFKSREAMERAIALDGTSFRGRELKIREKRTNIPGMTTTNRMMPRGRVLGGMIVKNARGFPRGFPRGGRLMRPRGGGPM